MGFEHGKHKAIIKGRALFLFDNFYFKIPETQGIKYAGSKLKLIPHILSLLDGLEVECIFDGFSGTTRVSQAFAKRGYTVFSNDRSVWSKNFGICYLKNTKPRGYYKELIQHLNSLKGYEGWFTENYGGLDFNGSAVQEDGSKRLWQIHNTQKLDAIRDEIEKLNLSEIERSVALTSLILALDQVDNTMGHFTSYLRNWSARSYNQMMLKVPSLFINQKENRVLNQDVFDAVRQCSVDFAYFDPPYGSNNDKMPPSRVRYASYYHIWTTICLHDKPDLFGAANRRVDTSDVVSGSVFEDFRKDENGRFVAVNSIERLIKEVDARYVALSYSSGGRATAEELNEILNRHGKLRNTIEIDYKKNVMANMRWTNEWVRKADKPNKEFLFLIEK